MVSENRLSHLLKMQKGKMRQISSQGRQKPFDWLVKAVGDVPGKSVIVEPGETYVLAQIEGAGTIQRIWMTTMQPFPGSPNFNDYLVLRFYWDDEENPSVEVPFGAFYGVPWGKYTHYVAEPLSCTSGGYNSRWQMPFSMGCRIEVENQSSQRCSALFFQIQYLELTQQPSPVRFHAQWRRENPTKPDIAYRVLDATGVGHFTGMHLFMQKTGIWFDPAGMVQKAQETRSPLSALFPEAAGMGMLEGWESIYVDGEELPSIPGTGNEDYFNSGFYFSKGPYSAPEWGCTVRNYLQSRCAAYRFHISDPIPFSKSIVVDIDHGYANTVQTDYSSVAYWYQTEPHGSFPVLLPAEDRLPTPVGNNVLQFTAFTSPLWVPAMLMGLRYWRRCYRRKKRWKRKGT